MAISSPSLKLDSPSPCGCRVARDEGSERVRIWYCQTHGVAFEVLQALQVTAKALNRVATKQPLAPFERDLATVAQDKAEATIRKAVDSYGYTHG